MPKAFCRNLFLLLIVSLAPALRAEFPTTHPYAPITYRHEFRVNPNQNLFIVTIDLNDPDVRVRVAPAGADPDGDGPWQTTLMTVREIAQREKFDVAVNASFFAIAREPAAAPIAEERAEQSGQPATLPAHAAGYVEGAWARSLGWTMSDGRLWSASPVAGWPILWVQGQRQVHIGSPRQLPPQARQIVAGNCCILRDGKPAEPFEGVMKVRHPRTVAGVNRDGSKLVLLSVDGRRPWSSMGMSGSELAAEMLRLDCWNAINLDGGGSTTLVVRDPGANELKVLNQPSDGRERPVSDVIGISAQKQLPGP